MCVCTYIYIYKYKNIHTYETENDEANVVKCQQLGNLGEGYVGALWAI